MSGQDVSNVFVTYEMNKALRVGLITKTPSEFGIQNHKRKRKNKQENEWLKRK